MNKSKSLYINPFQLYFIVERRAEKLLDFWDSNSQLYRITCHSVLLLNHFPSGTNSQENRIRTVSIMRLNQFEIFSKPAQSKDHWSTDCTAKLKSFQKCSFSFALPLAEFLLLLHIPLNSTNHRLAGQTGTLISPGFGKANCLPGLW